MSDTAVNKTWQSRLRNLLRGFGRFADSFIQWMKPFFRTAAQLAAKILLIYVSGIPRSPLPRRETDCNVVYGCEEGSDLFVFQRVLCKITQKNPRVYLLRCLSVNDFDLS